MKRFLDSLPFRLGAGAVLCLAAAYYIARCMAAAAGYKHGLPYAALIGLLMPALLWSAASPRLFWRAALPAVAVMGALHPVTRLYGHITEDYVLALLATDAGEASEFTGILLQVGWKTLALMLLALGILRALERRMLRGAGRGGALERFAGARWLDAAAVAALLAAPAIPAGCAATAAWQAAGSWRALEAVEAASPWRGRSTYAGDARDYVLVIGESARRDYFHVYGYALPTSPFLDRAPGATFVEGLVPAAPTTIPSLGRMLTLPGGERIRWGSSLLDVARDAGLETFWISNSGGNDKSQIPMMARRADHALFLRDSLTEGSGKRSDMALVAPLLACAAREPAAKARLFALHTVGSHPDARKKLWDMPSRFASADPARDDYVAAYASTILKTDRLLERIYDGMAEQSRRSGRPFSIVYFSDHGQAHVKSGGKVLLQHGPGTQGNWDVPLVRIDSDKRERRFLKSGKSGMAFAPGLMDWMGVSNPAVAPYRLFDGADDPQAGEHVCPGGPKACRKPDPARPIEARLQ